VYCGMLCRLQAGQTPMSIGERLGYLSVVETLRPVTAVAVPAPLSTDEKYRVISPEIMQEAPMSDSEEEGGTHSRRCLFCISGESRTEWKRGLGMAICMTRCQVAL